MNQLDSIIKDLKKIKSCIQKLDKNYKNNYIHVSNEKIKIEEILNKNNDKESWLSRDTYYNPKGLWFSCGSDWYKWLISIREYDSDWLKFKYTYNIIIDKSNILHIKKIDELIKFHNRYAKFKNNHYSIDWNKVKKDYDGIIICPYLGFKIWNENPTQFFIDNSSEKYILLTVGKNIKKYPAFFLEWYRHWETGTGVIWRKKAIKKLELIKL